MAPAPLDSPETVTGRAVRHKMLRAALELAVVVARSGAEARPAVPAPPTLRPFLRHIKWTPRALATVARVVDDDEVFRGRVAAAAEALSEADLDPWSRSWLVRPDGWAATLSAEADRQEEAEEQRTAEKDERSARRQLFALAEALERRTAELALAELRVQEVEAEVTEQRRLRRDTEIGFAETQSELASSRHMAAQICDELDRLAEEAAAAGERTAAQLAVAAQSRKEILGLQSERDRLAARVAELEAKLEAARSGRQKVEVATARRAADVAGAVSDAAAAARLLGEALARAGTVLGGGLPTGGEGSLVPDLSAPVPAAPHVGAVRPGAAPSGAAPRSGGARSGGTGVLPGPHRSRRRPLALPPAVFEDSQEAATHLVRPGVLLLVDGYNVSFHAWPGEALGPQRHRLITALAELAARSGAPVRVIFDGDDHEAFPPVPGMARSAVRVAFSSPGVDADEVIIEAVDQHPADGAVVVATDDRRVQNEVKKRGANVLTTPQLLGLLRRADQKG